MEQCTGSCNVGRLKLKDVYRNVPSAVRVNVEWKERRGSESTTREGSGRRDPQDRAKEELW